MAKHAPYNKLSGLSELANESPALALEPLKELAKQYPSDSRVLYALGLTHLQLGEAAQAIAPLEAAAKREREYTGQMQMTLSQAYSQAAMPAHSYRAATRAGQTPPPWQEVLGPGLPEGAKLADLLEFEDARQGLLRSVDEGVAALRRMLAFRKKFPDYLPATNIAATGAFLQGQFPQARSLIDEALNLDPRNIHALLNLARLERLLGGVPAVKALRPRVQAARAHDEGGFTVTGGDLALANIYLLMEDAPATRAAVDQASQATGADTEGGAEEDAELTPEAQQVVGRLERAEALPGSPLSLPSETLPPGWWARWRQAPPRRAADMIEADLRRIPGWYDGIERAVLYETGEVASALATMLLHPQFDASPLQDGVTRSVRIERFLDALQSAAGTTPGRLGVMQAMQGLELLPSDFMLRDAQGNEVLTHSFELTNEPEANPLSRADQQVFERAHALMTRGGFREAIALYEPLILRYPDYPSLQFNMAAAEEQIGTPELRARAQERVETLARTYPAYLFAPAKLALQAIGEGDLKRASELLTFPKGIKRLHVQEYGYHGAVLAILGLHEGELEKVSRMLDFLDEHLGIDSSAYRMVEQQITNMARTADPARKHELLGLLA